jgi:hypothetical protein
MGEKRTTKTPSFNPNLMPVYAMLVSRHASRLSSATAPSTCRELLAEAIGEVTCYCGAEAVECFLSSVKAWLLTRNHRAAKDMVTCCLQRGALQAVAESDHKAGKRTAGPKTRGAPCGDVQQVVQSCELATVRQTCAQPGAERVASACC